MRCLVLFALAGCGRIGFGETRSALDDGGVVVPDGVDPDALSRCGQPSPFLALIDVVPNGNGSVQTARFCAAGLPGPVNASMRFEVDGTVFVEETGPIELAMIDLFIGGANCMSCFVRLVANGVMFDGPVTDFIGD